MYLCKISALYVDSHFHQLLSVVISCWQLMTSDMKKNLTGIFMYRLKLILVKKFSSLGLFSFSSNVISCHKLFSAVDNWWQLIWQKFDWNIYIHTKVHTCAEFQLSRLIFIFISCQQLLSAVDSWWQLIWKKIDWNFYVHTKVDTCAKFQLSRLIFIFINCYQLSSAVESFWQLMTADMKKKLL